MSHLRIAIGVAAIFASVQGSARAGTTLDHLSAFALKRGPVERRIQLIREAPTPAKALALFAKTPEIRSAIRTLGLGRLQILKRQEKPGGGPFNPGLSHIDHAVYMTEAGALHLRQNDVHTEMGGGWDLWKDTPINSDRKVRLGLLRNNFRQVQESIGGRPDAPIFTQEQIANLAKNVVAEAAAKTKQGR